MEAYEELQFEDQLYFKLREAEREAELTKRRYSSEDVRRVLKDAVWDSKSGEVGGSACSLPTRLE